jgi:hypothetical protein
VLKGQWFNDYGPWGLQASLASDNLEFLDSEGVVWEDRIAGDEYVADEEEEEEDEEDWADYEGGLEDGEDEGEAEAEAEGDGSDT